MLRAKRELTGRASEDPRAMLGLGRGEDLTKAQQVKTPDGSKLKFQETYEGLPVMGASVVLEKDKSGRFSDRAIGHVVEGLDNDISSTLPQLSKDEILHLVARKNMDNPSEVSFDPEQDAKLEVMLEDSLTDQVSARLVYKMNYRIETAKKVSRPYAIVDANSGDIIKSWEGLSINRVSRVKSNKQVSGIGGNLKIGKMKYGGGKYPKLQVTKNGNGTCQLENNVAHVYSCNNSWWCSEYTETAFQFDCEKGFDDIINGAYSPLNDALFFIGSTYKMFDEWYNIKNPLQREGSNESFCSARVHFGTAFENAFWDGYYITFGDGNSTFYPLTSLNVVAHEIAHGVTERTSDLLYWGESGGMNEAFSDMAGEAVESYATQNEDWMVGFETFKDPKKALRYFKNPGDDGRSIGLIKQYCPGMDPHYSSGLFNRAFYYLGTTKGWDVQSAFHPFVVANQLYWRADSRFYEAACDVVQAARDLKMKAEDVTEAFRKVGVEPCVDTSSGLTSMAEISAPAGHTVIYHLEIPKDMDIDVLSIKISSRRTRIKVHTPSCDHCAEASGGSRMSNMQICDVTPGLYMIEMTPEIDMVKGIMMILGPSAFLVENATTVNESIPIDMEIKFPAKVSQTGQVVMRLNAEYGYVIALLRHGEPPSFEEFLFDHVIFPRGERVICDLRTDETGPWYLSIKSWGTNAKGIDLEAVMIMDADRVDKAPKNTRAPPTAPPVPDEGSGSNAEE